MKISQSIADKLKNKDEITFDAIYEKYYRLVKHVAFQITKDKELSEDISQDTFIKMIQKIDTHKIGSNFKYWLIQIAKNISYDYLRKNKNISIQYDDSVINEIQSDIIEEQYDESNILHKIKDVLDDQAYEIIVLRFYHELKFKEIAFMLNVSTATVTSKYTRAIKTLKSQLKKEDLI